MTGFGHCVITGISRGGVEQALHEIPIASAVSLSLFGLILKVMDHLGIVRRRDLELLQLILEGLSGCFLNIGQFLSVAGLEGFVFRLPAVAIDEPADRATQQRGESICGDPKI